MLQYNAVRQSGLIIVKYCGKLSSLVGEWPISLYSVKPYRRLKTQKHVEESSQPSANDSVLPLLLYRTCDGIFAPIFRCITQR